MAKFNMSAFREWENETHIPQEVKKIVNAVMTELELGFAFQTDDDGSLIEETITIFNRGGYACGYGKGFSLTYCTSSMADGAEEDPKYVIDFIKGIGFRIENSMGDNGMDSATNWHDTYWTYEFIFEPSITWNDFYEYEESDFDD